MKLPPPAREFKTPAKNAAIHTESRLRSSTYLL